MTLQEILKAKGMSDADIQSTIGEMKQNKIFTASEENLDIRYGKLKTDHDNLVAQHGESTKLIDQLKASAKGNEALQGKITEYESTISRLNEQLKQTQLDSELKIALLKESANDIDYLTFKLKEKGELELGEDGHIKGLDDKLAGLKTQFPNQFSSAEQMLEVDVQSLPDNEGKRSVMTQEQFDRMGYQGRLKLHQENPEIYAQMTGKTNQ